MVTIRSASRARPNTVVSEAALSRATGSTRARAPAASIIAFNPKVFEAMIWSGPGVSPGITSSSPVAIRATTGRRATGNLRDVHRGQKRQVVGAQHQRAGEFGPGGKVGPGGANVRGAVQLPAQRNLLAVARHVLLDHHVVGSRGHRRASEDAHRGSLCHRTCKAAPRRRLSDHAKACAGPHLVAAKSVAIHRRGGKRRLGAAGGDGSGKHPACGLAQRHGFGGHRHHQVEDARQGLVDGNHHSAS